MRDIKFRAWHPGHPVDGKNRKGTMIPWGEFSLEAWFGGDQKGLMQYTGLKDKNGKEIYDGDILELFFENENKDGEIKLIREVKWVDSLCMYSISSYLLDMCLNKNNIEFKVIGNIYENPELINKK